MGLYDVGFEVIGVDIEPQPNYPFEFHQENALTFPIVGFDFVWASPPCQAYCMYSKNLGTASKFPKLIEPMREILRESGRPYVIENVVGAPLERALMLCGTMFGLPLIRHRIFEANWSLDFPPADCAHRGIEIPVYGNGTPQWHREKLGRNITVAEQRVAMGIEWTTRDELTEAIPPAYSEFIARQFLETR